MSIGVLSAYGMFCCACIRTAHNTDRQMHDHRHTIRQGNNTTHFSIVLDRCEINEGLIKEVADAMVSSGLRDAGYVRLCIALLAFIGLREVLLVDCQLPQKRSSLFLCVIMCS